MRLKSGRTYWRAVNPVRGPEIRLRQDVTCDVAIVGGGIVGALLAYHLSAEGLSIVLVDKRQTVGGSTGASTALLLYELDVHLLDLGRMIGKKRAQRVYALSFESIAMIRRLTAALRIRDCYRKKKSLYVSFREGEVQELRHEQNARARLGFRCNFLDRATLVAKFGLEGCAAILSHDAAEVDPYRLTRALLEKAASRGVRIFERTHVRRIGESAGGSVLETAGHHIRARRVVMATGYESQRHVARKVVALRSSYVVVSEPIPGLADHWLFEHLLWETARPYVYVRTTADHRLMVGGEDAALTGAHGRDARVPMKSKRLQARFSKLFPALRFRPAYEWAGTFGETPDGMGYVGVPRGWKETTFVLAYGGNGITFGATAAELVVAKLMGRPRRDERLFSFDR